MWKTKTARDTIMGFDRHPSERFNPSPPGHRLLVPRMGWHTYSEAMLDNDNLLRVSTEEYFPGSARTEAMGLSVWNGVLGHSILRDFRWKIDERDAPWGVTSIESIHQQIMDRYAGEIISRAIEFYRKG